MCLAIYFLPKLGKASELLQFQNICRWNIGRWIIWKLTLNFNNMGPLISILTTLYIYLGTCNATKSTSRYKQQIPDCTKNKALVGYNFVTSSVISRIDCMNLFSERELCLSVNIARINGSSWVCEQSNLQAPDDCSVLTYRPGYRHYVKVTPDLVQVWCFLLIVQPYARIVLKDNR